MKKWNKIINDFGEDGLEIDIGTATYPNKTILIDRDVYENLEGKVTSNHKSQALIRINGRSLYLSRYIMGFQGKDKRLVVHKDNLFCDYRKKNLEIIDPQRFSKKTINKSVRDYWLEAFRNTDLEWWNRRFIEEDENERDIRYFEKN